MRGDFFPSAQAKRTAGAIAVTLLLAALAAIGYWLLFSHFAAYDDEGYILMSAREYFAQGRLYDHVYTQYGPASYVLLDLFQHGFGPVDNTSARWLTLALWLGTAGSCAVMVRRETESWSLTLFTFAATFLYLYFLQDEPFHPGALIIFILAASSAGLLELLRAGRWSAMAMVAAVTGSLLLLTKINVGIFYFAGVGAWALLNAASAPLRRAAPFIVVVGLTTLAAALMHALGRETWIHIYVTLFAVGALTVTLTFRGEPRFGWRHGRHFTLAAIGLALAVLAVVWLRGTSVGGLLDGVLLRPLRHPGSYSYPVDWRPGSLLLALVSVAIVLLHRWVGKERSASAADRIVMTLRVVQAVALLIGVVLLMHARVIGAVFSYVAPLIWISVLPLSGEKKDRAGQAGRGLIATILLLQYLHAYPVGGSQESWGTFLFIPLVALGLGEIRERNLARTWTGVAAAVIALVFGKVAWTGVEAYRRFASRTEFGLPGANGIRLTEDMRSAYQILALNAMAHSDVLFSLPGMFSFNLWTGLPAPTAKNTTLWFTLLTEAEQRAIIHSLERATRPCIIVQESLVELMRAGNVVMRGPLIDYVHQNFTRAFRVEGFAFLVRGSRQIAPLNLAHLAPPAHRMDFSYVGDGRTIASIEVGDLSAPASSVRQPIALGTEITVTPINSSGQRAGPSNATQLPLQVKGLAHLSIAIAPSALPPNRAMTALYLRDNGGKTLATVRLGE